MHHFVMSVVLGIILGKPQSNISVFFSRHSDKYVRKGRLDWPEGATSRDSIKAVLKLPRLQVWTFG